jgi:hypothetical protein
VIKLFTTSFVISKKGKIMNYEEKEIKERFGQVNPFRVPDGYFDQLTERVMSQLPEREQTAEHVSLSSSRPKSRLVALRPWMYAAACTVAAVFMGVALYFHQTKEEQTLANADVNASASTTNTESQYIDEYADYVMLDNAEIYAYLADNDF